MKRYTRVTIETVSDVDDNEPIEAVREFIERMGGSVPDEIKPCNIHEEAKPQLMYPGEVPVYRIGTPSTGIDYLPIPKPVKKKMKHHGQPMPPQGGGLMVEFSDGNPIRIRPTEPHEVAEMLKEFKAKKQYDYDYDDDEDDD